MEQLTVFQAAGELVEHEEAVCEDEDDILPFVLAISSYRRHELPRIQGYVDLINQH